MGGSAYGVIYSKLYLMNLCESGNEVLEAVHISPIPFHHSPHLPCLSQRLVTSRNSYLDHLQFLKLKKKRNVGGGGGRERRRLLNIQLLEVPGGAVNKNQPASAGHGFNT